MISIDHSKCTVCGICGTVCPRRILETKEENGHKQTLVSQQRKQLCMACGHCCAVCPNEAISIQELDLKDFKSVRQRQISEDNLLIMLEQRRSVRRYKDKPVPRNILDRIIEAARRAPTGSGSPSTGVLVIDKPEHLKTLSELTHETYRGLEKALANPVARFIIKRRVGDKTYHMLQDFVMPGMHWYLKWKREGRGDEILRDCKALMLFHCPIREPMGATNCALSAFHAILMAEVLEVGTCFNDLIPPVCNRSAKIRRLLALPEEREIHASLTMGFAKYKFQKAIPKNLAEVRYL